MPTFNFQVGDKVVVSKKANEWYCLTREGAIGTIVSKGEGYAVCFSLEDNFHIPPLWNYIHSSGEKFQEFSLDLSVLTFLKRESQEERIIRKIKTLDSAWTSKQRKKGNKYAMLLL